MNDQTKNDANIVNDEAKNDSGSQAVNDSLSPKKNIIAYLEKAPEKIKEEIILLIPEEVARRYKIAAFEKKGRTVKVVMVDPQNLEALNALRFVAEKEKIGIEAFQASERTFLDIFKFYSGPSAAIKSAVESIKEDFLPKLEGEADVLTKKRGALKDAPVAKLVQVIISHAIEGKASDIHIEPVEDNYRVRYRVDGILHISLLLPKEIGPAIISRIKILANLKIDEKRKPQDGRFRINFNGNNIDFRVSTLPVIEGEKVVMRILDKEEGVSTIENLGLSGTAQDNTKAALKETYGMILMTGPTGSGKSTTLYSLLKILNNEERNIITLEDPIEYFIEGLNQSQIKPEIDYTFANGLRSILRQDPNVIMVGEIRDSETAELAVHAALTGHLMFSTLHTNTAIGSIPRLIDMGIEPFLLSSSLRLVMAQRLVRKICEKCKEEKEVPEPVKQKIMNELKNISPKELEKYGIKSTENIKFFHGKGCDNCGGTGLKGRLAVFEAVPITEKIKDIIVEHRGSEEMLEKERTNLGSLSMKQDGMLKIVKGMTTIEEVERVTEGNFSPVEGED
ncbi:MAG TPA: GspE/PulE family protein [Patescibacteria group bacterium]|nr:GspE/PulE family protein [Patescibacteria group bacterium]